VEPRVRQYKRGALGHLTAMIKEIEIEHARRVSLAADATKFSFDRLQHREQVWRGEIGRQRCHRVNKPGLGRTRYRLGSIPSGACRYLNTVSFERSQGGREGNARRAEPRAGQIAADANKDQFVSLAVVLLDRRYAL